MYSRNSRTSAPGGQWRHYSIGLGPVDGRTLWRHNGNDNGNRFPTNGYRIWYTTVLTTLIVTANRNSRYSEHVCCNRIKKMVFHWSLSCVIIYCSFITHCPYEMSKERSGFFLALNQSVCLDRRSGWFHMLVGPHRVSVSQLIILSYADIHNICHAMLLFSHVSAIVNAANNGRQQQSR